MSVVGGEAETMCSARVFSPFDLEWTSGQSAILMLLVLAQEFVLGCRFVPMGGRVMAVLTVSGLF
jgi:hypothetical protein